MKTVIALLAVLAVAAVSVSVKGQGDSHTWISNQSSKNIRASTEYEFLGCSNFQNRLITPGTSQGDEYGSDTCQAGGHTPVGITLGLDGSRRPQQTIWAPCDYSFVGENNPDGLSVDIYQAEYGTLTTPIYDVILTISP